MSRMESVTTPRASFTVPILSTQDRLMLLFSNIRKIIPEITWSSNVEHEQEGRKNNYSSTLCDDIMTDIFSRLPVDDVYSCKLACEPWYRIISCPNFIQDQLKRCNNEATIALIGTFKSSTFSSTNLVVVDHQTSTSKFEKVVRVLGQDFALCASCDGLVLIRCIASARSMLYNPTTKELCNLILSSDSYVLGFFLDESTTNDNKEYKLLMYSSKGERISYSLVGLRTKLWTRLSTSRFAPILGSGFVHVGSTLFWIILKFRTTRRDPRHVCSKCIMVLELRTEKVYVIPHPGDVCSPPYDDHYKTKIWKMEGRLAFTKLFPQIFYKINVWVLQDLVDRSWVKVYEIDLTTMFINQGVTPPIANWL